MWKKVWDFVEEKGMLQWGDRVVVALSGGADSVCLLKVLTENTWNLRLRAVHVHHGLRGEEADRDSEFVKSLCARVEVPLVVIHRKVKEYAGEKRISEEEAGRILRYEALEAEARRWEQEEGEEGRQPVRIAVAHHQDDNAETILHHLLRGSGLRGVAGMQPVQGNRIRPLLGVRRSEILAYLEEAGWEWCEDSSNESGVYTRNRIRRELIPYMTERINARAVENLLHAGWIFGQADQYLERQAELLWQKLGQMGRDAQKGGKPWAAIDLPGFLEQEEIIRSYLIRRMLTLVAPAGQKDITARHIEHIGQLAQGAAGGGCDLPGGLRAVRTYQEIWIGYPRTSDKTEPIQIVLPEPGGKSVGIGNWEFKVFFREKETEIPKKEYTKWFDYDRIKATLWIRRRQQGDFLTLPGGGRKMLNRFFIDEKILREQREEIPVLAEENHILWVVGYRISEYYKIREATHTILQVDFYGGKAYGR